MGRVNNFLTAALPKIPRRLRPVQRLGGGRLAPVGSGSGSLVDFSSNDYLALSEHPALISESSKYLAKFGAGTGAARLMSGDLEIFHQLEKEVAHFVGQEEALVFGSGFAANIGIIPALLGRGDVVFADRLDHASIYDGCRLSGARLVRFRHNEPGHLEDCLRKKRGAGRGLIVVESIYSMDGDRCCLADFVTLKERYDCLFMVDEAHAIGLYGEKGGGVVQEDGLAAKVDVVMGTFGKALGSYGAFAAGSAALKEFLINRARSFIFSTALPPAVLGANLAAVRIVREKPELRRELFAKVELFKKTLHENGVQGELGNSQIVPLLVGDSGRALELAEKLNRRRIFATAVRPPTVPKGTARLRFSVTRHHSDEVLSTAAADIADFF